MNIMENNGDGRGRRFRRTFPQLNERAAVFLNSHQPVVVCRSWRAPCRIE